MSKILLLVLILALASTVAGTVYSIYSEKKNTQEALWTEFKQSHSKSYANKAEDKKRFDIFLANLKDVDSRNKKEKKMIHGITKFSDLSEKEFKGFLNTKAPSKAEADKISKKLKKSNPMLSTAVTPTLVDWTGIYTTPIKNQGYCGGCWAFSAAEQFESDSMRLLGTDYILSPEELIDCVPTATYGCSGCSGGWPLNAVIWAANVPGGIETESYYPYTAFMGTSSTCGSTSNPVVTATTYTNPTSETDMASYLQSTGPLSIAVNAVNWSSYTGGIMTPASCGSQTTIDHAVQAVGVYPVAASSGGYWKVRNQWGTSWGESGYIRLSYGQNTCLITYYAFGLTVTAA